MKAQALPLLAGFLNEAACAGLVRLGPLQTQNPRFCGLLLPA